MQKAKVLADHKLSKATRKVFIKHFEGKLSARAVKRKLGIQSTKYYSICRSILGDAIKSGQVRPDELPNN